MTELKDKLITIEGLQHFKSMYVPTKTSDLINDSNFITQIEDDSGSVIVVQANPEEEAVDNLKKIKIAGTVYSVSESMGGGSGLTEEEKTEITNALANKVDIVDGKWLSSNDYTDADKEKVDKIIISPNSDIIQVFTNKGEYKELGTINGKSILEGDVTIDVATGETIQVDRELSETSEHPVQNKVITNALNEKQDTLQNSNDIVITDKNNLILAQNLSDKLNAIHLDKYATEVLTGRGTYSRIGTINDMSLFDNDITIPKIEIDAALSTTSPNAIQNSTVTNALNDAMQLIVEEDSPSFDFKHDLILKTDFDNIIIKLFTQNKIATKMQDLRDFVKYYQETDSVVTGTYKEGNKPEEEIIGLELINGAHKGESIREYLAVKTNIASLSGRWIVPNPKRIFIHYTHDILGGGGYGFDAYPFELYGAYQFVFDIDKYLDYNNNITVDTGITETVQFNNFLDVIKNYNLYSFGSPADEEYSWKRFKGYVIRPDGNIVYIWMSFRFYDESNPENSILRINITYDGYPITSCTILHDFNPPADNPNRYNTIYNIIEKNGDLPLTDSIVKIIGTDTTLTKEGVPADAQAVGNALLGAMLHKHSVTVTTDTDSYKFWFYSTRQTLVVSGSNTKQLSIAASDFEDIIGLSKLYKNGQNVLDWVYKPDGSVVCDCDYAIVKIDEVV